MGKSLASILVFLALAAPLASRGAPQDQAKSELTGHYYLEGGPTEVGSELLLKEGGTFEWAMMYGAVDSVAQGVWKKTGNKLVLDFEAKPEPVLRMFKEDDYGGTKPAEPGSWIAIVGVPHVGPVADIEVRFEALSGKTATAVSKPNGDAIVSMPSSEVWARAGLRRSGSKAPWQWFTITPERAKARLVGFAVTNMASLQQAPFSSLPLRIAPAGLVIEDNADGLRGTYVKH